MLDQARLETHHDALPTRSKSPLIVVSNRAGVEHYIDDLGRLRKRDSAGGVAVALNSVARQEPVSWIAAAAGFADRVVAIAGGRVDLGHGGSLRLVDISEEVYEQYYNVFSNPILWFVHHSMAYLLKERDLSIESENAWRSGYLPANRLFARAIVDEIEETGATRIMFHDYHFYAAPRMVRAAYPEMTLQHFIHIPWPGPQQWQALPDTVVRDICDGLLANDSIAFQTDEDVENFLDTCRAYLGSRAQISDRTGEIEYRGQTSTIWSNPISVEVAQLEELSASPEVQAHKDELNVGDEKIIVRVDRLDPSKNILRGFQAYWRLLERNPKLHEKVRFIAYLVPSRETIDEYSAYVQETLELVDQINEHFGTSAWQPVTVLHQQNRLQAFAGLARYDVLLVNSEADGMNLVCKEGAIVNERDGVLILSETAGAYEQLRHGVIGVEPLDVEGTAVALERALSLGAKERATLASELQRSIRMHQLHDWLRLLLHDLSVREYIRDLSSAATLPVDSTSEASFSRRALVAAAVAAVRESRLSSTLSNVWKTGLRYPSWPAIKSPGQKEFALVKER